jgi:hypothetical protein
VIRGFDMSKSVSPHDLRSLIDDGGELALADVREEMIF